MARTSNNPRIVNRTVRAKLAPRRDPYWHFISEGRHLGYRRLEIGGTWIARHYSAENGRKFKSLGAADDTTSADGVTVLTYKQAQDEAQTFFDTPDAGKSADAPEVLYTVAEAMDDYIAKRERMKRKRQGTARAVTETHIKPSLGEIELANLTWEKVEAWRDAIAEAAPRQRTGFVMQRVQVEKLVRGELKMVWAQRATDVPLPQAFRKVDPDDPDAQRQRQATANRILTVLKAALNYAHDKDKVSDKKAWERVKPFRKVDLPKVRFLTAEEISALIPACETSFQGLVKAALMTGCRFGELASMKVSAFDAEQGTVYVAESKNGESRHVALNDDGIALFSQLTAHRAAKENIFLRSNGKVWKASEQKRPMDAVCEATNIEGVTFHILRHTYASHSVMNGMPIAVVADQLGHKDTRITERHYAHLSKSYNRIARFGTVIRLDERDVAERDSLPSVVSDLALMVRWLGA